MRIALVAPYWLDQEPEQLRRAEACARTALSLDDHDAASHEAMGYVCEHQREFDLAEMHFNRAMSLNPNDVYIAVDRANWLVRVDKPAEALQGLEAAMQRGPSSFSPSDPAESWSAMSLIPGGAAWRESPTVRLLLAQPSRDP